MLAKELVVRVKVRVPTHGQIWVEVAFQVDLLTKNYSIYTID
jgi:hypothetical protein